MIYNKTHIKKKLIPCDSPERIRLKDEFFTNSAVLFAIIPHEQRSFDLVLIHRTDRGTRHRGEISFPGGKYEHHSDNSLLETALRETEEEIGVPRDQIDLLGCLDDFPTMTKYIITPFVAAISQDQKLVKQETEVRRILKIPITFFIEKKHFKEQAIDIGKQKFPIFYFNYLDYESKKKYTIWGATAYMISTFIETVYGITMSNLGLRRFKLERIKELKEYVKYRNQITRKF